MRDYVFVIQMINDDYGFLESLPLSLNGIYLLRIQTTYFLIIDLMFHDDITRSKFLS